MSLPAINLPTIIQGPAYIGHGGVFIYVQKDITIDDSPESWNPETAMGKLGERHKSRTIKIGFTPAGEIKAGLLDYFYAAHKSPSTKVGRSIVPASNKAVTIYSLAENKTYGGAIAGLSKPPTLHAGPDKTAYGAGEITIIGDMSTGPLNANFLKAAVGASFTADTSFEESNIITDIYSLAIGARSTPYDAVGALMGFDFDFHFETKPIMSGDAGVADIILASVGMSMTFAPSNLTEAQVDTLLAMQNTGAVLPGQEYAKAGEDIVVTGTQVGWIFTAKQLGAKKSSRVYGIGEHRHKSLEFVGRRTWTSGVENALFAYTAPA